jgi:hypothetical protein
MSHTSTQRQAQMQQLRSVLQEPDLTWNQTPEHLRARS